MGRRTHNLTRVIKRPVRRSFLLIVVPVPRAPARLPRTLCGHLRPARDHAMTNLSLDIAGVRVGHADDAMLASGVTAVLFRQAAVAAINMCSAAAGTREARCATLVQ